MKKLLTGILATSMCLACLTACGGDNKVDTDLDGAAANLEAIYQDRDVEVSRDYDVLSSMLYDGQTYTITWSVDVTEGVKIVVGENSTTVDVNEVSEVDIAYVLTATVTDANGDTKTVSFNRVVKAASKEVAAPIQSAPVEDTAYKLHVYQSTKEQDCYFIGEMDGYYFKTSEDAEAAVDIYVEYKAGSETEFYPYFLDANEIKQYIGVKANGNYNNIVFDPSPVSVFVWNDDIHTITTSIIDKNGNETEFFLGNYQSYTTIQASAMKYVGAGNNIGHLIGMIDRNSVDAAEKIAQEKNVLLSPKAFVGETTYELAELGVTYPDVKISWAVEGDGVSVNGNVLSVKAGADTSTFKLKATLSCDDASDTAEFDVTLVPNDPAKIIAAGNALGDGGKIANQVTMTGVVTKVDYAYNAEFGNVSVTIDVDGTSVYCFRAVGAGADKLAAGYTITIKGYIENYQGNAQIGQGGEILSYVAGEAPSLDDSSSSTNSGDSSSSIPDDAETASIDMMGTTNLKNRTTDQTTYSANGITYVNDKAASTTDNYDQKGTYAARAYQGSTITLSCTTAFSKVVFTLDDYESGKYLLAFDGMEIAGATITRNNDVVTITLSSAVTTFTTANLIKQARIEKIEVFFGDAFVTPDDDTSSSVPGNSSSSIPSDDSSSSSSSSSSTPDDDNVGTLTAVVPNVGTPYIFGMKQGNLNNALYYLAGGMDGYYMATTTNASKAIQTYIETTDGGYYFYTYVDGVKTYINMVVSGTHVNGAYETTASTVYTIKEESHTLIAVVNEEQYWFGTRNDNTYTTMGPCKVSYNGFYGEFYEVGDITLPPDDDNSSSSSSNDNSSNVGTSVTSGLQEGVAYTVSANNANGTLWLKGTISDGRFDCSTSSSDAVSVYVEDVDGGQLLYMNVNGTKTYFVFADNSQGGSTTTDASAATVFEWNADLHTLVVAEDGNNRAFGVGKTSTYTNFSSYDSSQSNYNWGQFTPVGA